MSTIVVGEWEVADLVHDDQTAMPPRFPWRWLIMLDIPRRAGISIIRNCSSWRIGGGDVQTLPRRQQMYVTPFTM
jgi:hypothetical protein